MMELRPLVLDEGSGCVVNGSSKYTTAATTEDYGKRVLISLVQSLSLRPASSVPPLYSTAAAAGLSGDRRTPDSFLQQVVAAAGTGSSDLLCFQREQQRLEHPSPRRSPSSNVTGGSDGGGAPA
nr:hypothetical protein Iba_chr01aCG3950 [Ipomoea batatas]